jgi:hypothetical protein
VTQGVQYLPSKHKALNSNPSATKKEEERKNKLIVVRVKDGGGVGEERWMRLRKGNMKVLVVVSCSVSSLWQWIHEFNI